MKSKEFFSNVVDGNISIGQPIGLISIENNYPQTFVAAYFRRGTFPLSKYKLSLGLSQALEYTPSSDTIDHIHGWYVVDETDTLFSNRKRFEKTMQNLMTKVETKKDNFPLFVRDLSKLDGWK
jgi:hypothetical protein